MHLLQFGKMDLWLLGDPENGGDCSGVQDQLRRVKQVQATLYAFAAILDDGSVVTWGNPAHGGDSSAVKGQLKNVQQVQATSLAFAAVLKDGSVVTWAIIQQEVTCLRDSICFFRKMPAAWCVNPSMFRVTVTVPSAIHTIPLVVIDAPSILEMTGAPKGCCLGTRGPMISWLIRGIIPKWPTSLVNYDNLRRSINNRFESILINQYTT